MGFPTFHGLNDASPLPGDVDARLRALVEDISGIAMHAADGSVAFVELGLDSLMLTQVALEVKKSFKVNLSFRELMQTYRSFNSLGAFVSAGMAATSAMPAAANDPRSGSFGRPTLDTAHPPTPLARLGRDKSGQPAWYVPDPAAQGKFIKYAE